MPRKGSNDGQVSSLINYTASNCRILRTFNSPRMPALQLHGKLKLIAAIGVLNGNSFAASCSHVWTDSLFNVIIIHQLVITLTSECLLQNIEIFKNYEISCFFCFSSKELYIMTVVNIWTPIVYQSFTKKKKFTEIWWSFTTGFDA